MQTFLSKTNLHSYPATKPKLEVVSYDDKVVVCKFSKGYSDQRNVGKEQLIT